MVSVVCVFSVFVEICAHGVKRAFVRSGSWHQSNPNLSVRLLLASEPWFITPENTHESSGSVFYTTPANTWHRSSACVQLFGLGNPFPSKVPMFLCWCFFKRLLEATTAQEWVSDATEDTTLCTMYAKFAMVLPHGSHYPNPFCMEVWQKWGEKVLNN